MNKNIFSQIRSLKTGSSHSTETVAHSLALSRGTLSMMWCHTGKRVSRILGACIREVLSSAFFVLHKELLGMNQDAHIWVGESPGVLPSRAWPWHLWKSCSTTWEPNAALEVGPKAQTALRPNRCLREGEISVPSLLYEGILEKGHFHSCPLPSTAVQGQN